MPNTNTVTELHVTHTPRPWRLWTSRDEPGAFTIHGDSPHTVDDVSGDNMIITSRVLGTPVGMEGVANAHLISAAPELLDALKTARRALAFVVHVNGVSVAYVHETLEVIDAALMKAEGGSR